MGYELTDRQREWFDATARFAAEELAGEGDAGADGGLKARDGRGEFWRAGYERCGRFGLLGLPIPQEYGGRGEDLATTVAANGQKNANARPV